MSPISIPMSVPVKVQAQETNISFSQNDNGYFMNLDLKLELPLQELVDSLMMCGDKVVQDVTKISHNQIDKTRDANSIHAALDGILGAHTTPPRSKSPSFDTYYSAPFPRFDSPYRKKGRWQSKQATFFMKDAALSRRASPVPSQLSADAPVFTPMTFASVDSVSPPDLWELPGLPSPLIEPSTDPIPTPVRQTSAFHSILQRGLSNALLAQSQPVNDAGCRQM